MGDGTIDIKKEKLWRIGLWLLIPIFLFTPLNMVLFIPAFLFMAFPWTVIIISVVFAVGWFKWRNKWFLIAGALWLLYAFYEYMMYLRIWCTGECNIRIDLLVIYPLLLIVSVASVVKIKKPKGNS